MWVMGVDSKFLGVLGALAWGCGCSGVSVRGLGLRGLGLQGLGLRVLGFQPFQGSELRADALSSSRIP